MDSMARMGLLSARMDLLARMGLVSAMGLLLPGGEDL
jgi:hypothetical protein